MSVLFDSSTLIEVLRQREPVRSYAQAFLTAAYLCLAIHPKRTFLASLLISTSVVVNHLLPVVGDQFHYARIPAFTLANRDV